MASNLSRQKNKVVATLPLLDVSELGSTELHSLTEDVLRVLTVLLAQLGYLGGEERGGYKREGEVSGKDEGG